MDIKEKIQEIINHRKGLGTYVGKGHLDEVKKKGFLYKTYPFGRKV